MIVSALSFERKLNEEKSRSKTLELAEKISEVEQKNKDLEDSKRAIINILKDLNEEKLHIIKEKLKADRLSNDLRKFKLAVDNSSEQIIITDPNGIVLYANPATEKITGFSLTEIIGKKIGTKDIWGGIMDDEFYENLWKTVKTEKKHWSGEITNKHKNGAQYTAYMFAAPLLDKKGKIEFIVDIQRDISQEKALDKAKSEFLSIAAHQLRSPLGRMRWDLEIILSGKVGKIPEKIKKLIQDIYESDLHNIGLVNDLLSVSRIDQGKIVSIPVAIDVQANILKVIKELSREQDKKEVKIEYVTRGIKNTVVYVDQSQFHEVIYNLLSNAIRYSNQGSNVKISMKKASRAVQIKVEDQGIGISKEDQNQVFKKFFRGTNAIKAEPGGSGLGLFVVKSYVESWGGNIKISSKLNEGTTFTVTIPFKE